MHGCACARLGVREGVSWAGVGVRCGGKGGGWSGEESGTRQPQVDPIAKLPWRHTATVLLKDCHMQLIELPTPPPHKRELSDIYTSCAKLRHASSWCGRDQLLH